MASWTMVSSPTTTNSFLFTDIEASTARWERHPDAMNEAVARHDRLAREIVESHGGYVFRTVGDQICAVFADADDAVLAATRFRAALDHESWPEAISTIRARMGVHTGPAIARDSDYFGPTVNRVARLMDAGHGGQILLSGATRDLLSSNLLDRLGLADRGEHRLKDLLEPEHIYEIAESGEEFPALRTLGRFTQLPVQLTQFVGRSREVEELVELVDEHRLVTLTGPGGTGKTRLALQVAAETAERFDRVAFVSLVDIDQPHRVLDTIAEAMGLQLPPDADVVEGLAVSIAARRALIVVDNFEHVMEAAPGIGSVVAAVPGLHVVVTSRELLRLTGERHYPVSPMDIGDDATETGGAYSEAVDLFATRARAVEPAFAVDDEIDEVRAICRMVDGLPLAIELAAARIRAFPPATLRNRLESGLAPLGSGPVDAPARQRTIDQTVQWSFDLLEPTEKVLIVRLAVFSGGCTLDSVGRILPSDPGVEPFEALEALLDKSLLRASTGRSGEPRFSMLSSIHGFTVQRLVESGEEPELRRRHAAHFAELAHQAEPHMRSRRQTEIFDELEDEYPNLTAALAWSFGPDGDAALGLRLVAALRDFWFYQSRYEEMEKWVDVALSVPEMGAVQRAGVLLSAAFLAFARRDGDGLALSHEAAGLFEAVGDSRHQALALMWAVGHRIAIPDVDREALRAEAWTAIELARSCGSPDIESQGLNMLGELERIADDYPSALAIQQQALELQEHVGEARRVAMLHHNIGMIQHHLGQADEAVRSYLRSLDVAIEIGYAAQVAGDLIALAEQAALLGSPATGTWLYGAGRAEFERLGWNAQPADVDDHARIDAGLRHQLSGDRFRTELAKGRALSVSDAVGLARAFFASP
jgi:predicted ATPase/class 3 adenylate cyclase